MLSVRGGTLLVSWDGEEIVPSNPKFDIQSFMNIATTYPDVVWTWPKNAPPKASGFSDVGNQHVKVKVRINPAPVHNMPEDTHRIELRFRYAKVQQPHGSTNSVLTHISKQSALLDNSIECTSSNPCPTASVRMGNIIMNVDSGFADCEDLKVCLQSLGNTPEGFALRQTNALQLQCLQAVDHANISEACEDWVECLNAAYIYIYKINNK